MASWVTSPITYIYIYISDKIAIESDEIPMKSELHVFIPDPISHRSGRARRIQVQGCDVRPQDFWWAAWAARKKWGKVGIF